MFLQIGADVEDARVARWSVGDQPGSATPVPTPLHELPSCCDGAIYGVRVPDQPGPAELIVDVGGQEFRFAYEIVPRVPPRAGQELRIEGVTLGLRSRDVQIDLSGADFAAYELQVAPTIWDLVHGDARTLVSLGPELSIPRRALRSPSRTILHGLRSDGSRVLASPLFVPMWGFLPSASPPDHTPTDETFMRFALALAGGLLLGYAVARRRAAHRRVALDPPSPPGAGPCGR